MENNDKKVLNCTTCMKENCTDKGTVVKNNELCGSWVGPGSNDMVNHPNHYAGQIEVIEYIRDKLTVEGFTEYCCGNVLKYISRWRKKDGVQDLRKARVYLDWMIESATREEHEKYKLHYSGDGSV